MATRQRQNLGQGWWEMEDANGRVYYANKQTKQTSWKKPVLDTEPVQEPRVSRQSATKENDSRPSAAAAQEVWREVVDKKSGKTYYYNKETKETRWTNPAAESKRAESAASASTGQESLYPDTHPRKMYVEKVEPQSGRSYWVNLKTRATSWNPPEGWDTSADDDVPSTQVSSAVQSQVAAASEEEEEEGDAKDSAPAADGTQAGVGLFFDTHARSGGSMVKAIYSGSSAARCGKISIGDILCFVDSQDVKSQGPSIVRLMIVGPQGSYVTLGFCKEGKAADVYEVKLLRGSAESIAVLAAKGLELHAEIDALTQVMRTLEGQLADEKSARREESSKYRVMEGTMKDAWEEEKQRLTAAIEREKKLRRDSEMRERRLLDDRLAEALNDGDSGVKGEVEKLQNDLRAAQRRVRELESSGVTAGGGGDGEMKISSLGLMDNEWQEREQNLLRQLEDERFRWGEALRLEEQRIRIEEAAAREEALQAETDRLGQMVDEAVNLERANWVEECGRINAAYTEAQENLEQAKEREIRIVGELKQSKEQYKRDTTKLSSERDALEDAVLELNAKLKDAEVKRISAEERLKLLDAQLQRAQHQVSALMQQRIGGAYVAAPPSLQALELQHQQMQSQQQPMSTPRSAGAPPAAAPASFNTLPSAANTPAFPQQYQQQQQQQQQQLQQQQQHQPSPGSATNVPQTSSTAATAPPPSSAAQVPALFDLMSRSSGSTVRESVYALSLVAVEGEGRKAILAHSGSIQQLLQQLSSSDSAAVRYAALALGNLAMDADGRRAILQVPQVSSHLTKLLTSPDFETARYASLSVGNLVLEQSGRGVLMTVHNCVQNLATLLSSSDKQTVRYATGAIRNISVEEVGKRIVKAIPNVLQQLTSLASSQDQATARYATAALKSLS